MTAKLLQGINKIGKKKNKTDSKSEKNKIQHTFSRDFIVGIIELEKKHIFNFIKGEALNYLQTEDYYYGYFYKDGKLHYVAHKSEKDETGKISRLAYILMHEGQFYIVEDKTVFRFTNKDGSISQAVDYIDAVEHEETSRHKIVNLENKEINNPPDTLKMKWSLTPKNNYTSLFAATVFVGSMLFYSFNANEFKAINQQAEIVKNQLLEAEKAKAYEPIVDLSQIIKKTAQQINGRGTIVSARGMKNEIEFTIIMKNENDARTFMKEMGGGTYENGKIVLTAKYTAAK